MIDDQMFTDGPPEDFSAQHLRGRDIVDLDGVAQWAHRGLAMRAEAIMMLAWAGRQTVRRERHTDTLLDALARYQDEVANVAARIAGDERDLLLRRI